MIAGACALSYCSLAYFALACFRIGMSGSARPTLETGMLPGLQFSIVCTGHGRRDDPLGRLSYLHPCHLAAGFRVNDGHVVTVRIADGNIASIEGKCYPVGAVADLNMSYDLVSRDVINV